MFIVLNTLITSDGRSTQEIEQRIGQAMVAFVEKKRILVSEKINRRVKTIISKNFCPECLALYGCETWVIHEAEKRFLEAIEM